MRINKIKYQMTLIVAMALISTIPSKGQQFNITQINKGPVQVKITEGWISTKYSHPLGVFSSEDSLCIPSSNCMIKITKDLHNQFPITGPFKGTFNDALSQYLNQRSKPRGKHPDIGHPQTIYRADSLFTDYSIYISNAIISNKHINSNTLEIRRIQHRNEYYYRIINNSDYPLYVTIFTIVKGEIQIEETELVNFLVNKREDITLSDFAFYSSGKDFGYYAIGSFYPLLEIEKINHKQIINSNSNQYNKDFNIIITGHR